MSKFYRLANIILPYPEDLFKKKYKPEEQWYDFDTNYREYDKIFKKLNSEYDIDFFDLGDYVFEEKGFDFYMEPNPIIFSAWFDLVLYAEMPTNNLKWTILSKKIIKVFDEIGFSEYKEFPVRVIDKNDLTPGNLENITRYTNVANLKGVTYTDDLFSEVQIHSRFSLVSEDSDPWASGKDIILRDDINYDDAPLVFRDPRKISSVIVKEEVKEALEQAGIKGIRFTEPFAI